MQGKNEKNMLALIALAVRLDKFVLGHIFLTIICVRNFVSVGKSLYAFSRSGLNLDAIEKN